MLGHLVHLLCDIEGHGSPLAIPHTSTNSHLTILHMAAPVIHVPAITRVTTNGMQQIVKHKSLHASDTTK